jgi:hypothetical protein
MQQAMLRTQCMRWQFACQRAYYVVLPKVYRAPLNCQWLAMCAADSRDKKKRGLAEIAATSGFAARRIAGT